MSVFDPVRDQNAIDEVAFVIQFKESFPSDNSFARILLDLHDATQDVFPEFKITNYYDMYSDEKSDIKSEKKLGILCYKNSSNREIGVELTLSVEGRRLSVNCRDYSRWPEISKIAIDNLLKAFHLLKCDPNNIQEIGYQCIDKFRSLSSDYKVDEIFKSESDYLTNFALNSNGKIWHVHQGWLEDADVFNTLNINMMNRGRFGWEAIINHICRINCQNRITSLSEEILNEFFGVGHTSNKQLIKKLVIDSLLQKIGIE